MRQQASNDFYKFHHEALQLFIPARQFHDLKTTLFLRSQDFDEPLSAYIVSIKEAARILQLNVTECEIINHILEVYFLK